MWWRENLLQVLVPDLLTPLPGPSWPFSKLTHAYRCTSLPFTTFPSQPTHHHYPAPTHPYPTAAAAYLQGAAMAAAKAVEVLYSDVNSPIVTIPGAIEADSYYPPSPWSIGGDGPVSTGDAPGAIQGADLQILGGQLEIPSQYHFYMETQVRQYPCSTSLQYQPAVPEAPAGGTACSGLSSWLAAAWASFACFPPACKAGSDAGKLLQSLTCPGWLPG
jgi:hypothetical protein